MIFVLMGVSGSGKTTIGKMLAQRTRLTFADADDFHSAANKAKMTAGIPLTDEDRQPWLEALNHLLSGWSQSGSGGVLACSALKAKYRETLFSNLPKGVDRLIFLDGSKEMIAARLAVRKGSFISPTLLESQMQTLEVPQDALRIVNDKTPDLIVDEILQQVQRS